MQYLLAAIPIFLLLFLMTVLKWSGSRAGIFSWFVALAIAAGFFGLTPQVFWVSQAKGLLFSLFVLAVLWPALMLYYVNYRSGGISALTKWLEHRIADRLLLMILLAWIFSSILEGLAGFGLPIAVAAPMLVGLGLSPLTAVAAAAIGHAWAVTFGNMGMVFQSLVGISRLSEAEIIPYAALMMGLACLLCGLFAARVMGAGKYWKTVILLGVIMALVQFGLASAGLIPLSSFGASLAGLIVGIFIGSRRGSQTEEKHPVTRQLWSLLGSYGGMTLIMLAIFIKGPLNTLVSQVMWRMPFPEVITRSGFVTAAGYGQTFRWFMYPGSIILVSILITYFVFRRMGFLDTGAFAGALGDTWRSAAPATLGVIATVGLSMMMEHTGMTQLLARGLSDLTGRLFPLLSPLVGMAGAFATGSNTNSNVLFITLQKGVAELIGVLPVILVATQTAGGSIGSMISPAKLIIGCSTVGMIGKEGLALRKTLPYGLAIGLLIGLAGLALSWFRG